MKQVAKRALARCIAEERLATDRLRAGDPDRRGCWQSITDWIMEYALILRDERLNVRALLRER